MSTRNTSSAALQEIDRISVGICGSLAIIGWLMIYAANFKASQAWAVFDLGHEAGKQFFFIGICSLLFFLIQIIDRQFWRIFSWAIYGFGLFLLVSVLFFGKKVNGATAWFSVGGFSFQPSELVKFGTCLAVSTFLSGSTSGMRGLRARLLAFGIVLLPMALILLQPDAGSALVFLSFLMLFYREGLTSSYYLIGGGLTALVIVGLIFPPLAVVAVLTIATNFWLISRLKERREMWLWIWGVFAVLTLAWQPFWNYFDVQKGTTFWNDLQLGLWFYPPHALMLGWLFNQNFAKKNAQIQRAVGTGLLLLVLGSAAVFGSNLAYSFLKKHQQERIDVWLKPEKCDPRGALYNVLHSKMAIGSGGFGGKGFLDGNMTKLRYVPEQSTDFIFCTVGEEQGFLGVVTVVGLFFLLLWRITVIAERQRSDFARRYAWCVAGILFVHVTINLGMTMGLFPIIGIPLPFISYGGSSLIGFTLMMAVLLKLDSHRFSG